MSAAVRVLRHRVDELDAAPSTGSGEDRRLEHAALVLQQYTNTFMALEAGSPAALDPAEADAIVDRSVLLGQLATEVPALVRGPLDQQAQLWVGTARQGGRPPNSGDLRGAARSAPAVKPWTGTLYTSSASILGSSMWRRFLGLFQGSDLYPLPWQVWSLPAQGRVAEIAGARDWVALVDRYPLVVNDVVYPDWAAIAADVDAVHICLAAVVAIQGFSLRSARGLTAPGYWDVETTHWLRWSFGHPQLIEVVR